MIVRLFLVIFIILSVFIANAFANPIPTRKINREHKPKFGFTYSFEKAAWYGLEPRTAYVKALDDFDIDWVRLPFFWDLMRDSEGNLDLKDMKFAIEEAEIRNVNVIISLGVKTPFYPEIHLPSNLRKKIDFGQTVTLDHEIAEEILKVNEKVVKELSGYKNISHWQIENEPYVGVLDKIEVGADLVEAEVEVVRNADLAKRPVIINHSGVGFYDSKWKKLLPILKTGDVFGANAYFKTQGVDLFSFRFFGSDVHFVWPKYLVWPVQSWYFLSPNYAVMKNETIMAGADFWIMEMQAEPYIKTLNQARSDNLSFKPNDIEKGVVFLKSYGVDSIGLWGVSFWQYREANGDSSWVEAVKAVVN